MVGFLIMILLIVAAICVYTYFRLKKLAVFYGAKVEKISVKVLIIVLTIIIALLCTNMRSSSSVVLLHIIAISALLDVYAIVVKRVENGRVKEEIPTYRPKSKGKYKLKSNVPKEKKPDKFKNLLRNLYGCGILPVVITVAIIFYGFCNISNVVKTHYTVETEKYIREEGYRIALITDAHYGTIQDKEILKEKISEINEEKPDIVVLGGDIVDEGTSYEDMQEIFKYLSGIHNKYGIYFVYGNHDRQPYTDNKAFTEEQLENTIIENGIQILKDKYVIAGDDIILAGRDDAAWSNDSGRASVEKILSGADKGKYIIMIDHQPLDAKNNGENGVDLQLSGHTHGGQIWPIGIVNQLSGVPNYGEYEKGDCTVIVSSGFAGWGYPIRTGKHSEYVIIDIK